MNFYYENSNGRKVDLNAPPFLGVKSNDLFSYRWNYVTQGQSTQKIVKFEKAMVEKTFQIVVSGNTEKNYLGNLELLLQLIDVDINNLKMGKLWIDDYYLEGYIFASTKNKKYLSTTKTIIELTIVCEKGNWQSEEIWRLKQDHVDEEQGQYTGYGIIYPYDYPYNYSAPFATDTILNESYMDTDFEITFYGPWTFDSENTDGPNITIAGHLYQVDYELGPDDYMKINSKTKTATVYRYNGQQINVFNYRNRESDIFKKIRGGGNPVSKPQNAVVDVKLFYERSEPKYTEAKWT